jgi:uncharacterized protein YndB with AHSA1/START domain
MIKLWSATCASALLHAVGFERWLSGLLPIGAVQATLKIANHQVGAVMPDISTDYGTIVVERTLNVPISLAYGAFADAKQRATWGAPSDTAIFIYDETDFRVGGLDLARCGARDDPRFRVEARYVDIVHERRIVWTETIREIDKPLAVNITTLEFQSRGQCTHIKVTIQVTSFVGIGMIDNTTAGYEGSLANMARHLEHGGQ